MDGELEMVDLATEMASQHACTETDVGGEHQDCKAVIRQLNGWRRKL